jgi:hypothetical protein
MKLGILISTQNRGFVKPTVSDSFRSRFRIVEYPLQEMEPRIS